MNKRKTNSGKTNQVKKEGVQLAKKRIKAKLEEQKMPSVRIDWDKLLSSEKPITFTFFVSCEKAPKRKRIKKAVSKNPPQAPKRKSNKITSQRCKR